MNSRTKKFFSYYKPYLGLLLLDLLCTFVVSLTALLLPLCAGYITGTLLRNNAPLEQIYQVGWLMLGLGIVYVLCNAFVDYQGHMMGTRMEADMRRELFAHYQKLSHRFFDSQKTGQLMTRLTNDLFAIGELAHHAPEDLLIAVVKFIGVFIVLGLTNFELTLIAFCFLPIMAIYGLYFNQKMNAAQYKTNQQIGELNAQIEDSLAGIRVVQSFTNQGSENQKFALQNTRFVQTRRAWYFHETFFYNGMMAFTQLMTILVIVFGSLAIAKSNLRLDQLVVFLLCLAILTDPINRLINFARLYQEGGTGFNRFMEIMELEPEITDAKNATVLRQTRGEVLFKNVGFRYSDNGNTVLEHLNLYIEAGEFVALVGTSGVGKTTLCSLIPRFYDVKCGEILFDGQNIKDIQLDSLREQIGLVQQDVYLFSGTILENIGYGKLNASQAEIIEAAKKANAHEFITALPNGYKTDIGQRGVKLSGGQKQRLSIARVFLKNPRIIIFDEATSALDNESEKAVQQSLEQLRHNRTTLVIAHRLSTVRHAQRIIVLTEAGIGEQGTHEKLIALNGIYTNLYNTQLSH